MSRLFLVLGDDLSAGVNSLPEGECTPPSALVMRLWTNLCLQLPVARAHVSAAPPCSCVTLQTVFKLPVSEHRPDYRQVLSTIPVNRQVWGNRKTLGQVINDSHTHVESRVCSFRLS